MHFSTALAAMFVGLATAQTQGVDVQVVYVGWNPANNATGKKYWPEKIEAAPGTMVQFQFWTGNHTVTQSGFDTPCEAMEPEVVTTANGTTSTGGIKSGFMPVEASAAMGEIPTYTVMINDTKPLWFYCGQATHCQSGMAMVINEKADSGKTLDAYKTSAAAVPSAESPTEGEDSAGSPTGEEPSSESPANETGGGGGAITGGGGAVTGGDSTGGSGSGSTPIGAGNGSTPGNITGSEGSNEPPASLGSGLTIPSTVVLLAGAVAYALM